MKRLGIFVFYDREGIVDHYVRYLLKTMREHVTHMAVVCNGILTSEGRQALLEFSDQLFLRENKGYDAMALKMALTQYIGWETVTSYDEVIFFNDTFYGPIYPWQEMFSQMDRRKADFWGLTKEAESSDYFSCHEKKIPAYIQSYFYAFRNKVLCHPWFQEYWNTFDSTEWIFSDVTSRHERIFTKSLEEQGFSWDTYINADSFESAAPEQNFVQYYYIAYELIKKYRCPVIKRKNFIMKHLTENPGERGNDTAKALEYIHAYTAYDVNLIWDNLLRIYDMQDLKNTLNLNYIVPENITESSSKDFALILWLSHESCLPQCTEYIKRFSEENRIFIYSESITLIRAAQAQIHDKPILYEQAPNTDIYSFVFSKCRELAKSYRYLIFVHDVDYFDSGYFRLQQYSLLDHLWSSLLENPCYAAGMGELFRLHERLGLLAVPQPVYGTYFSLAGEEKSPFFAFCCRSEAVKKISAASERLAEELMLLKEDNKFSMESAAMERMEKYIQEAGYYTAAVMNTDYASTAYSHMQAILKRILRQAKRRYRFSDFDSYLDGEMVAYARRFSKVMVYGAGENGCRAACLLKKQGINFTGFIVSDGQIHEKTKYGCPVYSLSELKDVAEEGVIVSVASPKAQREIEKNLAEHNCMDVFYL